MIDKSTGCFHAVISHLRPQNVPAMSALCGNLTWYVGKGEAAAYRNAGAEFVVESGGLCRSRNHALEDAFKLGAPCVQLSDDLKKVSMGFGDGQGGKLIRPLAFHEAVQIMIHRMKALNLAYGGVAPTANLFYFNPDRPTSDKLFIVGDFIVVRPSEPRFDETLRLKEDYDFTLQHFMAFGGALRSNDILATFLHRTNAGGACAARTSELEQASIARLKEKWPDYIRDNPRRKDEILLRKFTKGKAL